MANCIVCGSDRTGESFYPKLAFNNKVFEYRKCRNCGLVYLVPPLTEEDSQKIYGNEYHDEFYFKEGPVRNKTRQTELLMQYKPTGRFLDYGCGDAAFLRSLRDKKYELNGAEYDMELVNKLISAFPDIHFYSITSLKESGNHGFDIIHLCDVLGQVADPKQVLGTLRNYLAPGGIIFIESPVEHNSHLLYIFKAGYFKLRNLLKPGRVIQGRPFRVMFSDRRNQELFFKNNGFKTLHYEFFEWAWPLPDRWKDARSITQKLGFIAGTLSKFFSKRVRTWGNRFYYIGTPAVDFTMHSV